VAVRANLAPQSRGKRSVNAGVVIFEAFSMFGWLRKKQPQSNVDAQIRLIQDQCVAVFTKTWRDLHSRASTPEELASEIEKFSTSAFRFMFTNYPLTKHTPRYALWIIIFTSVFEARTHPTELVNRAIDLLRTKYAS
jgi:hypothetical protein